MEGPYERFGQVLKISPTGIRFPDRPARSKSLCQLRYSNPHTKKQRALQNPRTSKCKNSWHFYILTDIISAVTVCFYNWLLLTFWPLISRTSYKNNIIQPYRVSSNEKINNFQSYKTGWLGINPLNPELNPICYLQALLGAHHFLHVSRIRVKLLILRRLMSFIYIYIYIWSTHSWCF